MLLPLTFWSTCDGALTNPKPQRMTTIVVYGAGLLDRVPATVPYEPFSPTYLPAHALQSAGLKHELDFVANGGTIAVKYGSIRLEISGDDAKAVRSIADNALGARGAALRDAIELVVDKVAFDAVFLTHDGAPSERESSAATQPFALLDRHHAWFTRLDAKVWPPERAKQLARSVQRALRALHPLDDSVFVCVSGPGLPFVEPKARLECGSLILMQHLFTHVLEFEAREALALKVCAIRQGVQVALKHTQWTSHHSLFLVARSRQAVARSIVVVQRVVDNYPVDFEPLRVASDILSLETADDEVSLSEAATWRCIDASACDVRWQNVRAVLDIAMSGRCVAVRRR